MSVWNWKEIAKPLIDGCKHENVKVLFWFFGFSVAGCESWCGKLLFRFGSWTFAAVSLPNDDEA